MKKIFFLIAFALTVSLSYGQIGNSQGEEQSEQVQHGEHFVIGLNKSTFTELNFLKVDLAEISKIVSAEFIYKDKVLIIETDRKVMPYMTYSEIESILLKYYGINDIYVKEFVTIEETKAYYSNFDKITLK